MEEKNDGIRRLLIDIPEEIMECIKNNGCLSVIYNDEVAKAIINGTPYEEPENVLMTERPQGEWIDGYCNKCGGSTFCDGWGRDVETRFCPTCGAEMRGGAE